VSQRITLVGAFKKPGTYDYISKRKLLDIIAMGEGISDNAGNILYLTRHSDDKSRKNFLIDIDELVKKGNMELNIAILGGDVLFIPEAGYCYVDGAVSKPGAYPIKGEMSITETIAASGGLSSLADTNGIKLIRYTQEGKREIVSLSYEDIQHGKSDQIRIKDKDVIYVEASGMKTFFYGLGLNLGVPGMGVGYHVPPK
jgi:polysaccharide export outer membrane protein